MVRLGIAPVRTSVATCCFVDDGLLARKTLKLAGDVLAGKG
jgi:hypothetical protein